MIVVLSGLSLFLLAALAFAVDLGYLWFHRQTAQNAADAACTAGAMDVLYTANGIAAGNFTVGTGFDCNATSPNTGTNSPAPCWYAATNGYASAGLQGGKASSDIQVSFPSSLASVASCNGSLPVCDASSVVANPFVQVSVTDRVPTFFMGLISGRRTVDVGANAACGVVLSRTLVPIVVLDPRSSDTTFSLGGTPVLTIYGGSQRSIQVNSVSSNAANGGGTLDLSMGGPNLSGSDFGLPGGPTTACCNFNGGSTGAWKSPSAPVSDPYAQLATPKTSGLLVQNGPYQTVAQGNNGCPDPNRCDEYQAGIYRQGITVPYVPPGSSQGLRTAIFDPGTYYVFNGFSMGANSCVRPSNLAGDGTGGTLFYFADNVSVSVSATAGKCPAPFNTTSGSGSLANGVKCTSSSVLPANIPSTISDSVLLGPCSGTYGDPLGTNDPIGEQRGLLFFQDRADGAQPSWGGAGQFLLSGTIYFHQCVTSGSDTGLNCQPNAYNDVLTLTGSACAGSYIIGAIITDQLSASGSPCITIDLPQSATQYVLKAALLK